MSQQLDKFNSVYKDFINDLVNVFSEETVSLQNYEYNIENDTNAYYDDFTENNYQHLEQMTKSDIEYFKNSDYNIVKNTKYKDILTSSKATDENINMIWKYLHTLFVLSNIIKQVDDSKKYIKNIAERRLQQQPQPQQKQQSNNVNTSSENNDAETTSTDNDFKDIEEFLEKSSLGKFAEQLIDDFSNYIKEDDIAFIKDKADPMDILKKIGNPLKVLDKLKDNPIQFIKKTIFKSKEDQERVTNIFNNVNSKLSEKIKEQTKSDKFVDEVIYILNRYNLYSKDDAKSVNNREEILKDIFDKIFIKLKSNDFNQKKLLDDAKIIIRKLFGEDIDLNDIIQSLKGGNLNYESLFSQANKILKKFGLSGEDGDSVLNLSKLAKEMKNTPGMSQMLNMLGGNQGGYRNLSANERRERMRRKLNEIKKKRQPRKIENKKSNTTDELDTNSNSDTVKKKKTKSKYIKKRRVRKKR